MITLKIFISKIKKWMPVYVIYFCSGLLITGKSKIKYMNISELIFYRLKYSPVIFPVRLLLGFCSLLLIGKFHFIPKRKTMPQINKLIIGLRCRLRQYDKGKFISLSPPFY